MAFFSTAEVIVNTMKNDLERLIGKPFEGGSSLFESTAPAFTWRV
jgi:hypothetical protein